MNLKRRNRDHSDYKTVRLIYIMKLIIKRVKVLRTALKTHVEPFPLRVHKSRSVPRHHVQSA